MVYSKNMEIVMLILMIILLYLICASSYTYGRVRAQQMQIPVTVPEPLPESETLRQLRDKNTALEYQNYRMSLELEKLSGPKYKSGKAVINNGQPSRTRNRRRHPLS